MPSIQAKIFKLILKAQRFNWARGPIEQQRTRQEKTANRFRVPRGIIYEPIFIKGIASEWVMCPTLMDGVILYLHGGAFALGSINTHREFLTRLASATRMKVLAINYRLAPEHFFPAALEDSLSAYYWLLSQGYTASRIVIAGDSAGGGLALSTILALRDAGDPLPGCSVCISPWLDLTLSGETIQSKICADSVLNPDILAPYAEQYAGNYDKGNALISPLFADLERIPPLLIHVGTVEILLDEAIHLSEKAQAVGVDVVLKTWEGMFHVFQMVPFLPESKKSLAHIAQFITSQISQAS
jgi:epsilon-lactone hydrolase